MRDDSATNKFHSGVAWSVDFEAVSDLTSTTNGLAAAVTIDTVKHLIGLDHEGRLLWKIKTDNDHLLIANAHSLFVLMARKLMSIDPSSGEVGAIRDLEPPLGGWTKTNALLLGKDLLIVDTGGLLLLNGTTLDQKWRLPLLLDREDAIQQLAHNEPWIAAVSNRKLMLISEQGELHWQRDLPEGKRTLGVYPLILLPGRLLVGLTGNAMPSKTFLYELSLKGEESGTEILIDALAMFCPSHVFNNVLVLNTNSGLAGFNLTGKLERLWSIEAPVTIGVCVARKDHLYISAWRGTLLRVALANGQGEVLLRLPEKTVWVPPAPHVEPGSRSESVGAIEHLAVVPEGIAFSVSWSKDLASIQFIQRDRT